MMKKVWVFAGIAIAILVWARSGCTQDLTWSAVLKGVRAEYKDVRLISTDSLAAAIASSGRRPILLDTRTRAEFEVSHLAGAIHVDPDNPNIDSLALPTDAPIVAYCSVGYRSGSIARELQERGYERVSNLEGSLFKWVNEGRPIVGSDGAPTDRVHPYNALWGKLLDADVPRGVADGEQ